VSNDKIVIEHDNGGGSGGLGIIILFILCWALAFGFTVGGKHYGVSCTTERGVAFDVEAVP